MNTSNRNATTKTLWIYSGCLFAVTLAAYYRVPSFEFLGYDDPLHVTNNTVILSGLSVSNILWAMTTDHASNWFPLTWISHMADTTIFGLGPLGPHAVNLALHVANTLLLFWVFRRMTGAAGRSALVAAMFAVHPLHVESVAWISERKDVLSTLFGMLALGAYAVYTEKRTALRYGLVCVMFAMSLMSKPMWVTLPFVLLLLDYWPLQRFATSTKDQPAVSKRIRYAVLEKLPLLGLTVASVVITVNVQLRGGAVAALERFPLTSRITNAIDAYVHYLYLFVCPRGLAAFYPHPGATLPALRVTADALVLAGVSAAALWAWRRRPYAIVGWLWYVGTLVPVIGIVQVGSQAYADRYTYLPLIGIAFALVWAVNDLSESLRIPRSLKIAASSALVLLLAGMTWNQSAYWRDDESLWRRALAVTRDNHAAHVYLGHALNRAQRQEEAISHFWEANSILDSNPRAYVGLGNALGELGRFEAAAAAYQKAIQLDDSYGIAYINAGVLRMKMNNMAQAVDFLTHGLRLDPTNAEAHNNLGAAYALQGNWGQATDHFREAVRLRPGFANAEGNLAHAIDMNRGATTND